MTELRLYVLLAISQGPLHGYAIGKEIEDRSAGRIDPLTGALYQALKHLTNEGLVRTTDAAHSPDARRVYFEVTAAGKRAMSEELQRLDDLVAFAHRKRLFKRVNR